MLIEHDIHEFTVQPYLVEVFERFVTAAAERTNVVPEAIGRIVVCGESRYGPTIASLKAGAGYTNNEIALGMGKTIPRIQGPAVVSDVVLRADLFGAFADVPPGTPDPATWSADVQQSFYVICHEFGHVHDHALRKDTFDPPDPRPGPFSISATADYYGCIVLTEFAACRNAASVMTQSLFDYEMQSAVERLRAIQVQTNEFLDGLGGLTRRALAHTVCQAAWVFLVEFAKLSGHGHGTATIAAEVRDLESDFLGAAPLTDALAECDATYPHWDIPSLIPVLIEVWQRYGREVFGVDFVRHQGTVDDFVDLR